tara:strand:- start:580 stop:1254 length:675 start_codon:yes stop_codon:yes gene_type:complete
MNYASLVTAIEDITENTFTVTQLNTFIKHAENTIFQAIKFPAMTKTQTTNTTTNASKYLTNTDYLYTKSFVVTVSAVNYTLIQKDHSFIEEAYPASTASNGSGTPKYYAVHAVDSDDKTEIIFGPAPNGNFSTVHTYAAYPDSITKDVTEKTSTNTSYLGDNFDNVLLDGALVQAARFMKAEGDIVAMYDQQFGASLKLAQELSGNIYEGGYRPAQSPIQAPVA